MYYLELIERFWIFNHTANVGSTAIAMYLYLLKTAEENDGYVFVLSDVVVSNDLGLTRKTVKSTKEKLRDLGLIEFQTKNGVPCSYRLLLNYNLQISKIDKIMRSEVEKTPLFKEAEGIGCLPQVTLQTFSPPEIADTQNNNSSLQYLLEKNSNIPDFDSFIAYAKTLEMYESSLDPYIRERFDSWAASGWKNGSGRSISNWRHSLKGILPFMKNTPQNDQFSIESIPNIKRPTSGKSEDH
ncbi:hypothetical protein EG346_15575 [Chryseobacterium carnipullorum]|uniref:Helix-turn-helix domain-containing protein n=2 Tax=Chryseobacterium carnipullorum TaxID=1124835 RepID=A0A376DS09_CHRCU|nr:hypothetical protein [Chryseobacterium carnipullorum]AZA49508.1 hypothetical protein EG346_15575 [Chryseobacterium carnipullorum]STC94556.1 Uncharacterised protein [Chryseobacterium carnipullorum]